jgi:hypothetical protein
MSSDVLRSYVREIVTEVAASRLQSRPKTLSTREKICSKCGVKFARPWFNDADYEHRTEWSARRCTLCDDCLAKRTPAYGHDKIDAAQCKSCHKTFSFMRHGNSADPRLCQSCEDDELKRDRELTTCQKCGRGIERADSLDSAICDECERIAAYDKKKREKRVSQVEPDRSVSGYSPSYARPPRRADPTPRIDPTDPKWW